VPDPKQDPRRLLRGFLILVCVYLFVVYVIPKPGAVKPEGWRLTGVFIATIAGSILQDIPGGALVMMAIVCSAIFGGLTIAQALAGYSDPTVWLVMAAFFISRSLINTGLARRIALLFVRRFGSSSLGISYALALSDGVLAMVIPSNGARSGGVILPIVRSIAELYGSSPGETAGLIGAFLMTAVYQSICVTSAMFFTGQASNPLAAQMAGQYGFHVTWAGWALAGLVPGLCSLAVGPWIVLRINRPKIIRTPEASEFAASQLLAMGKMQRGEKTMLLVFLAVCLLWSTSGFHGLDVTVTALLGSVALIVTGVLSWEDVKNERTAWDLFIWYGGLVRLGKALNDSGVTTVFAKNIGTAFGGASWVLLFAAALLIYFYAHYGFASITTHLLAMYPPFLAILSAKGAPIGLMVFAFACFANFSAGLTNYGTTPSPMFFAQDYVSLRQWWKVGFVVSLANLAIWSTIGFAWWHLLGIW
jgi:DASS family divalent anion:Na+ symporter